MAARFAYADQPAEQANEAVGEGQKRRLTRVLYAASAPHHGFTFKPFTRQSMANIQKRRASRAKRSSSAHLDPITRQRLEPDPYLVSGQQLPRAIVRQMPAELIGKPIEDIDPFYADQDTFVIISRGKELTRFSATKALYLFDPFHPIRRVVLYILVNPIFNLLVILTILTNCILMTIQGSETVERTEIIFTIVYTTEMGLKVLARGFIVDNFTYLRDPWNWLDFAVIIMAYLTIVIQDLGNLSVMRTFRVLRALKTVAIIPGMKTIVGAVIDSVKNLKDVVVLTLFSLSVFSLLGLQIYMGILTQKCIMDGPTNMTNEEWHDWCSNSSHWIPEQDDEIFGAYRLCGNATGAQSCPIDHTCIQGFGPNPDYGFTNFDTFGWALICSFRLMTQDFWEGLYMQVLKTAGSWHIIFFIVSIFLGSIYLMNLILAIVAMSYNELQRRAEEEEEAAAEDEAAFLEQCRLMELQDQMTDYSGSIRSGASSYRPSVEIGLVGQSMLANLCRNGLLGQQVSEKLNQQIIMPSFGANNLRSHSFSVDAFDSNNNRALPNSTTFGGPRKRSSNLVNRDLFMTASSMTELRRKSSVRTNGSGSPTNYPVTSQPKRSICHTDKTPAQDQAYQMQQQQQQQQQSNKLSPNYRSSSILPSPAKGRREHGSSTLFVNRRATRSSVVSVGDMNQLRQRAALIRIGSQLKRDRPVEQSSLDLPTSDTSFSGANNRSIDRLSIASSVGGGVGFKRRARLSPEISLESEHRQFMDSNSKHRTKSQDNSQSSLANNEEESRMSYASNQPPSRYRSESIIVSPRSSLRSRGGRRAFQGRRSIVGTGSNRSDSQDQPSFTVKTYTGVVDTSQPTARSADYQPAAPRQFRARPSMSSSARVLNTLTATPINSHDSASFSHVNQLGIESNASAHHLSVENFHQFWSNKPPQPSVAAMSIRSSPQPSGGGGGGDSIQAMSSRQASEFDSEPQLRAAQAAAPKTRLESQGYIHPNTMVRSSFSRPRASFATGLPQGGGGGGGNVRPGPIGARRVSQDFIRRASNWSRLSMSGNVDMRRLLKLWSHTNPYQGAARPSVGSFSNFSQVQQSMIGSSIHSIRNAVAELGGYDYAQNNLSPRPSSVGSARQAYELISAMSRRRSRYQNDALRYMMPALEENLDDKLSVTGHDKCLACCLSCLDIVCIWECCGSWIIVQKLLGTIVFDPFTEMYIIFCILINTLFMALDSDDADDQMRSIFESGNYFFTATFAIEAAMKIMALSPKFYFREGWNVFDAIIVGLSLLELGLEGVYGLSVLRSFRLLRVFKLAKSWPTLNLLISIMGKAVGDLGNLTFVLSIIVFIFAVMGMQLFGAKYVASGFPSGDLPRWNFTDFMHSFMIVFRILCAEWIEPMWDCLLVGGWPCIPFFLIAVTVGNLVVLNLFLALLLASFGASNLSSPQADNVDTKKLQEAIGRFARFSRWIRSGLGRLLRRIIRCGRGKKESALALGSKNYYPGSAARGSSSDRPIKSHIVAMSKLERLKNIEARTEELKSRIRRSPEHQYHLRQLAKLQLKESNAPKQGSTGYNYNYNQLKFHQQQHQQQQSGSKSMRTYVADCSTEPMPVIPIIVDEAVDKNSSDSELTPPQEQRPVMTPPSLTFSADNSQSSPPVTKPQMRHPSHCSMQPIREDSRDRESMSSQSDLEFACPEKSLDRLARDEVSARASLHASNCELAGGVGAPVIEEDVNELKEDGKTMQVTDQGEIEVAAASGTKNLASSPEIVVECPPPADEEQRPKSSLYLKAPERQDMEEEDERTLQSIEKCIENCLWVGMICLKWFLFRQHVRKVVEHKYFDQCILVLIIISSSTLALEDKHLNERPTLKWTLDILDTIFTIIFSVEMIMKWLAFGLKRYFGNIWSWLDFIIVLVSFINLMASLFGSGKIQALKTMRTLRAMRGLRPLRALQRFQGMRVVVNALIQAIPSIFNVLLVCLIFWLIFSIMGVQMFGGKFWRCLDPDTKGLVDFTIAENKHECLAKNLTWSNPQINFDNVLNAYLALFQVATFKGWIDIMNSATDSRNRDDQPIREANIYMYFYFVFFVIFGSFFTLNLFIGVIIDNFNEQKKKTGGSLEIFMTDDQKKYYHAMKKMRSKRPTKAMTRPKMKLQAYMFDLTTSKKFDLAIMLIIGLNMFVMALEHYGQSQEFSLVLENLNLIFITIFTLECLCKIFAMRHFYFREPWNIFDFIVVALSILGVVMKEYVAKYFVSPTLLRVVRVVKVGRVLRLVKGAKGIRTLLFALAMSLPALFNICLLLFLVMFIYAIFGMSFFMNVRRRSGVDETFNFDTFTSSIVVLFQMSTSAGWDLVLDPLMDEENDCQKPDPALGIEGTCGNKTIAIFYLISYVIVTFLIIINMYIAVILENYSQATEDVQQGLTDDDYEMYYEIWQKFDPDGTQYLPYERLSDFVDALEDPLRIAKPNELALVALDITIYKGNRCYCVDILDALTKFFFTRKGLVIQVNEHLQKVQSTLHETPFERLTTTYMLKREQYCARLIQNCWRKWKAQKAQLQDSKLTETAIVELATKSTQQVQ